MICIHCEKPVQGVVLVRDETVVVSCPQCGYEETTGPETQSEADQAKDLKTI